LSLLELVPRNPTGTVASVVKLLDITKSTASRAIEPLLAAGMLVEFTGGRRDRRLHLSGLS
jgi:Fic family protein